MIIGGASILGGRGRVIGTCLGALLVVLIDKVLREGWPITRIIKIDGDRDGGAGRSTQLPAGAVPAFLGLLLLVAVLIEPYIIRAQAGRRGFWAWLRGKPPPPPLRERRRSPSRARRPGHDGERHGRCTRRGFGKFLARRDALAIILTVRAVARSGSSLRPDYWWNLPNSFAILLNYTELALLTIGLTYVIAAGDIDLSVGAVLALAGSTAAFFLKVLGARSGDRRGDRPPGRHRRRAGQRRC